MNDAELLAAFQDRTLPSAAWTHEAHLRIAWLYVREHAIEEAHLLVRVAIIRLNAAHGLVETAQRGYHETLTRAWLHIVAELARDTPSIEDSRVFLQTHATRLGRDAPLRHYSRERLFSIEARARFVEPDLVPFGASA